MILKKQLTLEDVLEYIGINYSGVTNAIEECATSSRTWDEFFKQFNNYYSEHGLGGDDRWLDVKAYLPLVLELSDSDKSYIEKKNRIEYLKESILNGERNIWRLKDFYNNPEDLIKKQQKLIDSYRKELDILEAD